MPMLGNMSQFQPTEVDRMVAFVVWGIASKIVRGIGYNVNDEFLWIKQEIEVRNWLLKMI